MFLFRLRWFLWLAISLLAGIVLVATLDPAAVSQKIHSPRLITLYICCATGALTIVALFYALLRYRRQAQATPFHRNPVVEIIWSVIPILILLALAAPSLRPLWSDLPNTLSRPHNDSTMPSSDL